MAEKLVLGLSGGVDSAVAAWRLREAGFDVLGVFMRNWEDDDGEDCPARQDFLDAMAVADHLGIELEAVNFAAEYRQRVFAIFLAEYAAGRTPNPDVLCNSEIKFAAFLDHARSLGARRIATGHYAGTDHAGPGPRLLRAVDGNKDQTYFLHRLRPEQLEPVVFPLADLSKPQVRALARQLGLPNHARRDSTGICFIGERPFRAFLGRYLSDRPGPMCTPDGRVVGEHPGLHLFTLGQRHGLGLGGPGEPWFVAEKRNDDNTLVVVRGHRHPLLWRRDIVARNVSWIGRPPRPGWVLTARTRHRQPDAPCVLMEITPEHFRLRFAEDQFAPAPGQSVVLYEGRVCLGGGVIDACGPAIGI